MCKYDSGFIIKYRDSIISKEEKDKFELHMLNCEACRSKVALDKEFISFLKAENSTAKNVNKIQVMSNIDLNKYSSGKGNFMTKLQKWKSVSIKVAAISIICIGGLSLAYISPIREGFKTLSLSVLNKQIRVNDNVSAGSLDNITEPSKNISNSDNQVNSTAIEATKPLEKNEIIIQLLKEYDLRYFEGIKNLKNTSFEDLFIDNSDTLIARRKFETELLIRRKNQTQFNEYRISYSSKGQSSFKFTVIDDNNIKVDFYKDISYYTKNEWRHWESIGIICTANVKFEDGIWKISSYLTDECQYWFLDGLKGKTESDKYNIINQHYDDALNE